MDHTYVDEKSLKTLEELAIFLGGSLKSLQTLLILQVQAIKAGIMPEDMNTRASHLIGKIQELMSLYYTQLDSNLELLPQDWKEKPVIQRLKERELVRARSMIKGSKEKT